MTTHKNSCSMKAALGAMMALGGVAILAASGWRQPGLAPVALIAVAAVGLAISLWVFGRQHPAASGGCLGTALTGTGPAGASVDTGNFCPLHSLFENSGDLIQSSRSDGRLLFANKVWHTTLGYAPEELGSLNIFQIIHPDNHEHCRDVLARLVKGENVELVSVAFRHKHGARIELEGRLSIHQDPALGGVFQGVFRDITKRQEAVQNFERFFKLSQDGLTISDFDGVLLRVNPALAQSLGYTPEELIALPRLAAVHPEDAPILEAALQRLRAGEPNASFEVRTQNRQGEWRIWSWKTVGVPEKRRLFSSGQDVTELRRATAALRQSAAEARKLALIAAHTVNGVVLTDREGRVEWINEGFTRLTGYTLAEVLGKKPGDLLQGPNTDPGTIEFMRDRLRTKQGFEVEVINYGKGGREYWVAVEVQPLLDDQGVLTHFMGLQVDITGQKQAKAEIQRLNAQLAQRVETRTAELQESERRRHALLSHLQGMAYRCRNDRDWTMEFVSDGCKKLLGIPPEEMTSQRIKYNDLIHPDDQLRVWAEVQACLAGLAPYTIEYRVKHAAGGWRWVWEQGHGVFDSKSELQALEGFITDITQRKQAEEELKLSEIRYRSMFENNHVPVLILEPETGRILDANLVACQFYGWDHATLTAKNITDLNTWSPEDIALEMRSAQTARRNIFSFQHRRADGSIREVEVVSGPILLDGHQRLLSLITDVTERKQAEVKVRESEERLQQITYSVRDAVWLRDARSRQILFVNPAYETLTGMRGEQFYQDPDAFIKLVHPEDLARVHAGRNASLQGILFDMEHRIIRVDGQERWVRGQIIPVRNRAGEVYRLVAVWNDITERVQNEQKQRSLEEQFRQVQKMEAIGQLAGGVAHDFNNLLAVILMQIDLMRTEPGVSPIQLEYTGEIMEAAQRATGLTRQLLMFSRRQAIQPKTLGLNEVVSSVMKMLQRILGEDVQIQVTYAPHPLWILADAGMMDQILMNLVVNARDAMPGGGNLAIATEAVEFTAEAPPGQASGRVGQFACLRVKDSGCGISPENLQRIFEPFFTTKGVGKGTGLGLATVFGIVQQHEGWIEVTSEVGSGTTFSVYLPSRNPAASETEVRQKKAAPRGGQEVILLVEDEAALRILTGRILGQLGYRVLAAENGRQAKELWAQNRAEIKLLLTDMIMPGGISGKELAGELLAQNPELKVIYVTGYSAETLGETLVFEEGINFLFKPFEAPKLAELVRRQLDA